MGIKRKWKDVEKEVYLELILHIDWSGYHDSGRISGPPEDCYPPEGEDERIIDSVEFVADNGRNFFIDNKSPAFKQLMEILMPRSENKYKMADFLAEIVEAEEWDIPERE